MSASYTSMLGSGAGAIHIPGSAEKGGHSAKPPFLQQNVYDWLDFSWFICESPHFSDIPVNAYIFFTQRFVKAAISLGIQWIDCYICLTTSNKWV